MVCGTLGVVLVMFKEHISGRTCHRKLHEAGLRIYGADLEADFI